MENLLTLEPELVTNVRRTTLHGREYVVADVTILKEGVLSGSKGPLFYPFEEIARRPGIWNGVPLTNGHPTDTHGSPISGRTPDALNKFGLGYFFADNIDSSSKTRKGEIWVDVQVANRIQPELIPALDKRLPIDVSTGLFTSDQLADNNATHNGTKYTHIARDHIPDHLAILLKERGACSVKDGCGINVNATSLPKDLFLDTPDERILGTTQNCPKCGAMLGTGASKCPACGAKMPSPLLNVFCATGPGGGVDPTCSVGGGGGVRGQNRMAGSDLQRALKDSGISGGKAVGKTGRVKHSSSQEKVGEILKGRGWTQDTKDAALTSSDTKWVRRDQSLILSKEFGGKGTVISGFSGTRVYSAPDPIPQGNSLYEVPMDRPNLINWLTTNCACWKGKDELLKNDKNFTDEELKTLKANAENSTLAINTLREIGTTLELPKTATVDDLKGAVTNMFGKSKSKNDDDDDDEEEDKKKMKTNKEMVVNALKEIPEKEVLELFPSLKQTVNAAQEVVTEKRMEIMRQLTANISDEKEKKAKLLMLKDKTLPQLREFQAFAAVTNQDPPKDENEIFLARFFKGNADTGGNYTGAAGTDPTANRSTSYDKTKVLLPTLNLFDDEQEEEVA